MPASSTSPPPPAPGLEPDLRGRVFLVTGATSGIGRVTAAELARRGAHVFLACRDLPAAEAVAAAIRASSAAGWDRAGATGAVEVLPCDLGDLRSVEACAAAFVARRLPLSGLVNNAGLAGRRGLTASGFELAFGVNHLGHFLLTQRLLDPLRAGAPARVVNVASEAHRGAPGIDFEAVTRRTTSLTGLPEYAVSKLCNILFTRELGRRLAGTGITTYALHPGVVATGIWRAVPAPARWLMKLGMLSAENGARTSLHCATAPELATASGRYYEDRAEARPSRVATDDALAARLWDESARFVG
jgi:NAD(P)-dependent dehydrogenase (short-subunit alcohol dehydrogenase family)